MKTIRDLHATLSISRTMGIRREEYVDHMTFRTNRRPLFTEIFGPLLGLREEWAAQGASPEELDFIAFPYRAPLFFRLPVQTGWIGGCEEEILEENEEMAIARDQMGRRVKLSKKASTLALPMDYPVRTMDDWLKVKPHYQFSEDRFEAGWEEQAKKHQEDGYVVVANIPGGFDEPRQLLGEENLCMAFYSEPEMIHDMLETMAETALRVFERVTQKLTIDQLSVHEDMAGKSGPLAGPRQVREFIAPYYRKVWDQLSARGTRLFFQDSDGDMTSVLPDFIDAGLNIMSPMEPVGHNDIVKVRERFGSRMAFVGGIDKYALLRGPEAIEAELEYKVPPLVRTGGCMLALDHRLPNGILLENYRFYIRRMWEILQREAPDACCCQA
jgi:hypothetical protein